MKKKVLFLGASGGVGSFVTPGLEGDYDLYLADIQPHPQSLPVAMVDITSYDQVYEAPLGIQYMLSEPITAAEEEEVSTPSVFRLSQNYPNPFNASTWISFELAQGGHVALAVYTMAGQRIRTLVDKKLPAGISYTASWNGRDEGGQDVASGVYVAKLLLDDRPLSETMKMTLVR